jgi:hypothetical protein
MFDVFRLARTAFPGREDKSFVGVHDGKGVRKVRVTRVESIFLTILINMLK